MQVDRVDEWTSLYQAAGLTGIKVTSGPFEMMTMRGFLADEGLAGTLAVLGRALSRRSYLAKMAWLMPRMQRALPYLGYVVIAGSKPPVREEHS